MRQHLLPREAAAALGVTVGTLRAWADAGLLPATVTPTGHRRYAPADVAAFRSPPRSGCFTLQTPDGQVVVHGDTGMSTRALAQLAAVVAAMQRRLDEGEPGAEADPEEPTVPEQRQPYSPPTITPLDRDDVPPAVREELDLLARVYMARADAPPARFADAHRNITATFTLALDEQWADVRDSVHVYRVWLDQHCPGVELSVRYADGRPVVTLPPRAPMPAPAAPLSWSWVEHALRAVESLCDEAEARGDHVFPVVDVRAVIAEATSP